MRRPVMRIAWVIAGLGGMVGSVMLIRHLDAPCEIKTPDAQAEVAGKERDLDMGRVRRNIETLCAAPSRVTGYGGEAAARAFITNELAAMGARDIVVQEFPVAVPINRGASLEARGATGGTVRIALHALWPNLARTCQTPPEGLAGPLVDIGRGTEGEMRGKAVAGSVVVLDWDTDTEWMCVPEFGGKAVVFRGSRPAGRVRAQHKFLTFPADVPRYYVAEGDVSALDALAGGGAKATVRCESAWEPVTTANILARIGDGTPDADAKPEEREPVVFSAYYDSIGVVPDLAKGAEQACGPAALLELGRYLAAMPSSRPVYLLFTGGHGQMLAGMVQYVKKVREGVFAKPGLVVSLDLSSSSESFGVFCLGHFRAQYEEQIRHKFSTLGAEMGNLAKAWGAPSDTNVIVLRPFEDGINPATGRGWWTYFPYPCPFESEIPTLAGIPGITLATVNDERRFVDTPDDTPVRIRHDLLERQLTGKRGDRVGLARIAALLTRWKGPFTSMALEDRWSSVEGRVVWLDQRRNFTPDEPLVHASVFLKVVPSSKYFIGTRGIEATMTDAKGRYRFDGLIRVTENDMFNACMVEAYATADRATIAANANSIAQYREVVLRAEGRAMDVVPDGAIIFGLDMTRQEDYPSIFKTENEKESVSLVAFPCRSFTVMGMTDPRGYVPLTDLQILDATTKSSPFQFGKSMPAIQYGLTDPSECAATLWADPSLRIMLVAGLGFQEKRLVLVNNSVERPEGAGFVLNELKTLPSMVLQGGRDMWNLTESRLRKLERNGVRNPRVRALHDESAALMRQAADALDRHDYQGYRVATERGWALGGKAYVETLATINSMIHGVLFYLALLLPLAYCLERLFVASETIHKRVQWIGGIFAASFVLLAVVHPAFKFTLTPLLVLLAFVIITLVTMVGVLILSKMDVVLQERKRAAIGRHEDQYRRAGVAVRALDLGMSNIRRRPQRGFLTGLSVVVVTFILLSFTSLVPSTSISRLAHPHGTPTYPGLLSRDRAWLPLPDALWSAFCRSYGAASGAIVAARAWFYSDTLGQLSLIDLGAPGDARRRASASALVCLDATEPSVTGVDKALLAGRWFSSPAEQAVILSRHMAAQLGYSTNDVNKPVRLFGRDVPLVGIVDGPAFDRTVDLDGEPLTPVNVVMQQMKSASRVQAKGGVVKPDTLEEYVHYSVDQVAIVPLDYGIQLRASIRSVAVRMPAGMDTDAEAAGYARRANLTVLGCSGTEVKLYAALNTSQISAAWQIGIPLILGFIMILGTMLGSVYERRSEIFVYNSVGLSPTNVSSLFIAEAAVYAIVGAGLGYLLGQSISRVLHATGWLPGLTLNYTAGTTVLVTVLSMAMVFLSAVYPARQAFRAAIPDVEKEVEAEPEAVGDAADTLHLWLPFVAAPQHVGAMQAYLAEYLDSIQGVTIGQLAIDNLAMRTDMVNDRGAPVLEFRAWLSPFDLGVSNDTTLAVVWRPDRGVYQYRLVGRRYSGDRQNWRRLVPRFVQTMRKQLLMWRILSPGEHKKYIEAGARMFHGLNTG